MVPENLLYTDQHEWIKVDGNVGTVGITDYAQSSLGDITFIELPNINTELTAGDEACSIESSKAASSIYAPAGGKIIEVNTALEDNPEVINSDPCGEGWIFKIELTATADLEKLLTPAKYEEILE